MESLQHGPAASLGHMTDTVRAYSYGHILQDPVAPWHRLLICKARPAKRLARYQHYPVPTRLSRVLYGKVAVYCRYLDIATACNTLISDISLAYALLTFVDIGQWAV